MSLVTLNINGKELKVEKGTTILDAAKLLNINIPTLCNFILMIIKQKINLVLVESV